MPARRAAPDAAPPHDLMAESDKSLVAAAERAFGDDIESSELEPDLSSVPSIDGAAVVPASTETAERAVVPDSNGVSARAVSSASTVEQERIDFGRPTVESMITVRGGGLYLPVRRRVGWMRGMPEPHPDWTIAAEEIKVVEGTFKGTKVEGGYARVKAFVYDENGRLIATGTKTEYSERFTDFVEKAETGAIGRALAVAGYGTEAAVDLDEGYAEDRIADAPVTPTRPINITASTIPGVRPGGRPAKVQDTQINAISRLNRALGMGTGLVQVLEAVKGSPMPPLEQGKESAQVAAFIRTFTHDQAGEVVQVLTKALKEQQAKAGEE